MKQGIDCVGVGVVYFCHDGNGNFLMNKRGKNCRDEHGVWDIGGGGIEFGDTVENTLKKEVKEEYSTDILEYQLLGYRDVYRIWKGKKTHWVVIDFKVLVDKEKAKNGEPHKFDAIEWFTTANLPTPLYPQLSFFFEKYKDKL